MREKNERQKQQVKKPSMVKMAKQQSIRFYLYQPLLVFTALCRITYNE